MIRLWLHSQYLQLIPLAWALLLLLPGEGRAETYAPQSPEEIRERDLVGPENHPGLTGEAPADNPGRSSSLNWETGDGRSYLIPGAEILTYLFLLNQFDRHFTEPMEVYRTNGTTIREHLTDSRWVIDNDQFSVNQFLHPYSGSIYFGLARSAGLSFWESSLYSVAGSFLWEIGGEKTSPSINDMITTPIGGTFLGEPFFRMANLLLESSDGRPGFWRELGAAIISPPTGFNRLVFGNRFDTVYPSHRPATFLRLEAGGTLTSSSHNVSSNVNEHGAVGEFTLTYGLPGKPGYGYTRPFDYFDFHVSAATANTLESITTRGLLAGKIYASGETTRGIWGLFGSYDYISPQVFRVSSTALSLGTVWQSWLSKNLALQGTFRAGPDMVRPEAFNARRNGTTTTGRPRRPWSRSA